MGYVYITYLCKNCILLRLLLSDILSRWPPSFPEYWLRRSSPTNNAFRLRTFSHVSRSPSRTRFSSRRPCVDGRTYRWKSIPGYSRSQRTRNYGSPRETRGGSYASLRRQSATKRTDSFLGAKSFCGKRKVSRRIIVKYCKQFSRLLSTEIFYFHLHSFQNLFSNFRRM